MAAWAALVACLAGACEGAIDDRGVVSAPGEREREMLTVMSWNTAHGRHTSLEAVEFAIGIVRPDVVLLQEIHAGEAESIAAGLGMEVPGGTVSKAALFATPEVDSVASTELSGGRWPRSLDVYRYRGLTVANVHLDVREADRRQQAREVIDVLDGEAPAIVGGDLNDTPDSEVLDLFREAGWIDLGPTTPTYPRDEPEQRLDYILGTRSWPRNAYVYDNPMSDHLPVVVEVALPE